MISDEHKFNLIQLAWTAGFWEGEGSCGVYDSNNDYKRLVVSVVQTDIAPIDKFCNLYSGSITKTTRPGVKDVYKWELGGTNAYLFLNMIRPYIVSTYKQSQIDSSVTEWERYRTSKGKTKYITYRHEKKVPTYEVRINDNSTTRFVGSFKTPEQAQLALYEAVGKKGIEIYDFNK